MTEIRAITIRQPYAWAIVHGGKDVENRSRNIAGSYRGPVAIHTALQWDEQALAAMNEQEGVWEGVRHEQFDTVMGAFIGVVDLVDVHYCVVNQGKYLCLDCSFPRRACSHWAMGDQYHLVLANPRPLPEPVPHRGKLGLWRINTSEVPGVEELL